MSSQARTSVRAAGSLDPQMRERPGDPCIMVIFGASGDLTKRLLMPAIYNLACDKLLPERLAIVGLAMDEHTTESFRDKVSQDIRAFSTRREFDAEVWGQLVRRLYYIPGKFDDPAAYEGLATQVKRLDAEYRAEGNVLFYLATPPSVFGMISSHLESSGVKRLGKGWKRVIIEKPFGNDLTSAVQLNRQLLQHWSEDQIYRIDHYLGKETVQNIIAFRFSNGIFEPLWNKSFIDHIQFTVTETVGVEGRGRYYERAGVLRDMIQNHLLQMLAYICMEPPPSLQPDAVRDEKAKLLKAVRIMKPADVPHFTVRGQYGPGQKGDGAPVPGYRGEPDVDSQSGTETFAALKLYVDNWRWEGVPIYLRSGKSLWKKETEITVQFKKAPEVVFRDTPVAHLDANQLIFHIQPDQGIELRFQAKTPGPSMHLQKVNMRFNYGEAFEASRGTGYETLLYNTMIGDATLFSRTDLVETTWEIAQPILDSWASERAKDFPNYPAGSWGPREAFDLIEGDGRRWVEVINRDVLQGVPLFQSCSTVFLNSLSLMLKPVVYGPGEYVIKKGEAGHEMYFINRGRVEVLDASGKGISELTDGNFFGEVGLLFSQERTASVRAVSDCDLFVLEKADLMKALKDHPQFAGTILEVARERYHVTAPAEEIFDSEVGRFLP